MLPVLLELMLLAVAVAVATRYVRLPYTVALVVVGLAVALATHQRPLDLSHALILNIFLPPLLFEGAISMDLELLRRNWRPVALLATLGVAVTVVLLALPLYAWLGFPAMIALLLAVTLSPTDPVSVLATFREFGVSKDLSLIVEGESVFNDGVSVVLFLIVVEAALGHDITLVEGVTDFVVEVGGGAVVGLALGYLTHRVLGRIDDHVIEVVISLLLAYGVYWVAGRVGGSGVIAVVVAGLIIGNYGRTFSMSPSTRISLSNFWEVAAFVMNSLLFLLIGFQLEAEQLGQHLWLIVIAFLLMTVARAASVYGVLNLSRAMLGRSLPGSWQHAIQWAGLRGSIPIALVLGLPVAGGAAAAEGALSSEMVNLLQALVFGAVFLSITVQGVTLKPLLVRLGLVGAHPSVREFEVELGTTVATKAALRELNAMVDAGELSATLYAELREPLERTLDQTQQSLGELLSREDVVRRTRYGRAVLRLLHAQRAALEEAFRRGLLGEESFNRLREEVDARIVEGEERGWEEVWTVVTQDEEEGPPGGRGER